MFPDLAPEDCRLQRPVAIVPGVDQQIDFFRPGEVAVMNEGTDPLRVAVAFAGERQCERFPQSCRPDAVRVQETHLPGLEIQLDAVMLEAVHAEDPQHALIRVGGRLLEKIGGERVAVGHEPSVPQVEPGGRIAVRVVSGAEVPERVRAEAWAQPGLQRFVQERHGRTGVHEERQRRAVAQSDHDDQMASAPGVLVHGHAGRQLEAPCEGRMARALSRRRTGAARSGTSRSCEVSV